MKTVKMLINADDKRSKICKEIYGHFTEHLGRCIYGGIYVGANSPIPNTNGVRNDIIEAFRKIKMPVLRYPGGCFADGYHWRDGIGAKSERKKAVNNYWGGGVEDNTFGTHEFFDLCELIGCEPYLAGNLGSGSISELSDWIEYITYDGESPLAETRRKNGREKPWKLKYLGIGNENWGYGGNMNPEYYASEYRRYKTFVHNYGENVLFKIACGPNTDDYNWTDKLMEKLVPCHADAISLHYYVFPTGQWEKKGGATDFPEVEYYSAVEKTFYTDELIKRHINIMSKHDPDNNIKLVIDEWGVWCDAEPGTNPAYLYQQNTMRDAVTAAISLNIFNKYSNRVIMANIAQTVNVLQSLILTKDEKMILTPTYHVFDLFKSHMDADLAYSHLDEKEISHSASVKDNALTATFVNTSLTEEYEINCDLCRFDAAKAEAYVITEKYNAYNDFDGNEPVKIKNHDVSLNNGGFSVKLPPCSVVGTVLG